MTGRNYAFILGILAFAFFLRVLGQAVVAFFQVEFLPPMDEWYSGVIPYPVLLPVQILILLVQVRISRDIRRGRGFFARGRPRMGVVIQVGSCIYFAMMVARYAIVMTLFPERRWFGGTIPIFFHWVLAAYLFALGRYYVQAARASVSQPPEGERP